jgi:hypothetical protein
LPHHAAYVGSAREKHRDLLLRLESDCEAKGRNFPGLEVPIYSIDDPVLADAELVRHRVAPDLDDASGLLFDAQTNISTV